MKKWTAWILAILVAVSLCACSEQQNGAVRTYTVESKFNSETVNQWKTLYLLNEDQYVITVYALDSQDSSRVTADFYMTGKYITNEDGSVTLQPGYGHADVLNGDTPISMTITPDVNGRMHSMYYSVVGEFDTFILNQDGTWTGV